MSFPWVFGQGFKTDGFQAKRNLNRCGKRWVIDQNGLTKLNGIFGYKGTLPSEQLKENNSQTVDIGAGVDLATINLFWRHVGQCPCRASPAFPKFLSGNCNPEIGQIRRSVRVEKDVCWFDVSMNKAVGVGML